MLLTGLQNCFGGGRCRAVAERIRLRGAGGKRVENPGEPAVGELAGHLGPLLRVDEPGGGRPTHGREPWTTLVRPRHLLPESWISPSTRHSA